jgi:hypothetical protein
MGPSAGINVSQGDNGVVTIEQKMHFPLQFIVLWDSAISGVKI